MFYNIKYKDLKNNILFIALGFLVFSSLSSTIMIDYLHFPISMPEILFVPFVFLLWDKILSVKFTRKAVFLTSLIIFVLLFIGLLCGEFPLYAMLSSSRSWFYMLICVFAFSCPNKITNEDLMWLSLGSILAWLVDSLMNYQKLIESALTGETVVTYGLMLAVPIFIASTIYRGRYFFLLFGIIIIGITVIFAGLRRLLAMLVMSLLMALLLKVIKHKKQIVIFFIIGIALSGIIGLSLPMIGSYVKETSPAMYYRVFERTGKFLDTGDSGSAGDESRLKNFKDLADNIFEYTMPQGMVSVQTLSDKRTGVFNDFPLYQLVWIFGWLLTLFMLYHISLVLFRNYRKYMIIQDELSYISIIAIIDMFMLLFLEGTYIEYPYVTPITGVLLGRAILNSKSHSIIQ